MAEDDKPSAFDQFDAKLRRLQAARPTVPEAEDGKRRGRARLGDGFQVGVELVAGMVGGLLIGWGLDSWFGTLPLFLVVFLVLGFAAGMLNVYRTLKRMGQVGSDGGQSGPGA
jgi:ATP synthase protein I